MVWRGFLLFLPLFGISQNLLVTEIVHNGNTLTMDYIIHREIQHPIQTPLDSALAEEDQNRLINLGIFADVKWRAIPLDTSSVRLEYVILENDQFFGGRFIGGPAPTYDERTGWSIGGGGLFKNFRGRNETIGGGFTLGGRNTFAISYLNPWVTGDHVSLNGSLARVENQHPFLPYEVKLNSMELNVGRFFGYTRKVSIGFELEDMTFLNDSTRLNYKYFAPQGFFHFDTRDIFANPTKGLLIKQSFTSRIDLMGKRQYNLIWNQSFGFYKQLSSVDQPKPWILALGFRTNMNFGIKDPQYLVPMGHAYSVRGWPYPALENYFDPKQAYRFGFHSITTSVELRKVLIPRFPLKGLWEFGLTGAFFFDWGVTNQTNFSNLFEDAPISGTGVSFQFQMPFVPVLRFDFGYGFYDGKPIGKSFHLAAIQII